MNFFGRKSAGRASARPGLGGAVFGGQGYGPVAAAQDAPRTGQMALVWAMSEVMLGPKAGPRVRVV
jgi:hypothetical protein